MSDLEFVVVPRELYYHEAEYVRGLERLAHAVLLFHRGGEWAPEDQEAWFALIGEWDATTKVLCNFEIGRAHV